MKRGPLSSPPRANKTKLPRSAKDCSSCEGWKVHCEKLLEESSERERKLDARETAISLREEALTKRAEQLKTLENKLNETRKELNERQKQVERERELVIPPSVIRQKTRRSKIEERMQLAITLNKLPREVPSHGERETVKEALARMGKSYQEYYEGNGFLEAGFLYGDISRFLELFSADENLTNITPVARLLEVMKNRKWRLSNDNFDEPIEERSKIMLHAFRRRVTDAKTMRKVTKWLKARDNSLAKVTEDELTELLYTELPEPEDDNVPLASTTFKAPVPLHDLPDKLTLRNEKLQKKISLADQYDEALDKEFFFQQHGKYNVLLGRALRTVCEAYRKRGGGMGRLDGSRFFFNLFPAGQSGKRKRADLSSVEKVAILVSALGREDEEMLEGFVDIIDLPEQMENVCKLAENTVELSTASVKEANAIEELKSLLKTLEQRKRSDSLIQFIRKYATEEVPFHKNPVECYQLLEKHLGNSILNAFYELSRVEHGENINEDLLKQSLIEFSNLVEQVYDSDLPIRSKERDAFIIAAMLIWKRNKEINKVDGISEILTTSFSLLGSLFGKPGRQYPVYDAETGSDEHLFTWPS